jgi:hypothetical protein
MGFLSNLFGANREDRALREAFAHIRRILEDEKFQLEMIHPSMRSIIEACPVYDRDPNGTGPFGFCETNPIPVNGPSGQLAYLSKLETHLGERILFHRIGAMDRIDVFEAVTLSGSQWFIFFLDFYHPRRSRQTPDGFRFTSDLGQFSGFHNFCDDFPYDFVEMKQLERESGLSMAYIPISKVTDQIHSRVYNRPLAHRAKLDLVNGRLTSFRTQ